MFGAATGGKTVALLQQEGKLTLDTELKLLKQEAGELGQNIGNAINKVSPRLNPANYRLNLRSSAEYRTLGSSGGIDIEFKGSQNKPSKIADMIQDRSVNTGLKYNNGKLGKNDIDLRDSGKSTWENLDDALEVAFQRTGIDRSLFRPKKWVKDIYGKSKVTEWQGPQNAEVNVDFASNPTYKNGKYAGGPDAPHVGWQQPGKGGERGHILLNEVPYGRPQVKNLFDNLTAWEDK